MNERWRNETAAVAVLLSLLIARAGSAVEPPELERQINDARELATSEDYARAIEAFTKIIEQWPNEPRPYTNRGVCYFRTDEDEKAVVDYNRALELCGEKPEYRRVRVITLTNRADAEWTYDKLDPALMDVESAIALNPDYAASYTVRAKIFHDLGDYDAAVESLNRARSLDPTIGESKLTREGTEARGKEYENNPQALAARARRLLAAPAAPARLMERDPRLDQAVELLDRSLALDATYAEGWFLRGQAAEQLKPTFGSNPDAVEYYSKAIEVDPRHARAWLQRGLVRLDIMEFDEAAARTLQEQGIADLDKAIELGAGHAGAFMARGKARAAIETLDGAVSDYTRALELGGEAEELHRLRAAARVQKGDWAHAIEDHTVLIDMKPSAPLYANRGDDYSELRQWDKARADYDKAIELDPKDANVRLARARMFRLKGDQALAFADYSKARELDDSVPEVKPDMTGADQADASRHNLQRAFAGLGTAIEESQAAAAEVDKAKLELEKSRRRLGRSLGNDRRTPQEVITEVDEYVASDIADDVDFTDRAWAYGGAGEFDSAIADCNRAIAINPASVKAYEVRGMCHDQKDELDLAYADFTKGIELDGARASLWSLRASITTQRKQFDQSLSDLNKAIELDPGKPSYLIDRAKIHCLTTRYGEAIADCESVLKLQPDHPEAQKIMKLARSKQAGP